MDKEIELLPEAHSLTESLRSIGYSLEAAIADIVDNSITADASKIQVFSDYDESSSLLAIVDNGLGMDYEELKNAMRIGCINPLDLRSTKDLGRFGLGLKMASFSQCRKLTVFSKKASTAHAMSWDLDVIKDKNKWILKVLSNDEIKELPYTSLIETSGTVVIWENLDRIIDRTSNNVDKDINKKLVTSQKHLEKVFHRYLSGEIGLKKVSIDFDGHPLSPFDPFNTGNDAKIILPEEKIEVNGKVIKMQPYILPHHNKCSESEYKYYAGEEGYLENQGFYIYRNKRLLISGTWFGLTKKENLTRLARVRVDLPNDLDIEWKIDVKKSSARPPMVILDRFKNIIEKITGSSTNVYATRGARLSNNYITSLWEKRQKHGKTFYAVNKEYPLIKNFSDDLPENMRAKFDNLISLFEKTFPVDLIFHDISKSPKDIIQQEIENDPLMELCSMAIDAYRKDGLVNIEIYNNLKKLEIFANNWDSILVFLEKLNIRGAE